MDWRYLRHRIQEMGFHNKWIKWIMMCVTTVSCNVCFSGSLVGPIFSSKGLIQGDPLSPYLFLLCVEGLSQSLEENREMGKYMAVKSVQVLLLSRIYYLQSISFLFF